MSHSNLLWFQKIIQRTWTHYVTKWFDNIQFDFLKNLLFCMVYTDQIKLNVIKSFGPIMGNFNINFNVNFAP